MSLTTIIEREKELDDLYTMALRLNDHERKVLLACAKGLIKGQKKYAEWEPSKDSRNLAQEALEESLDMSVYLSMLVEKSK